MKKKIIFLMSALLVAVLGFASFVNKESAQNIVYDFSVFDETTDMPTTEYWTCTTGSWGSARSAGAMDNQPINSRLADVLFTCTGSSNIIWQLYENDGLGNQLVANSSTVSITLPKAAAGDQIVFYASGNQKNGVVFAGQTIAKDADYADYTLTAEADAPTIALPKGLCIRTITIKKGSAAEGTTWDFTAITETDMTGYEDGAGNMTGKYSDDPNVWASLYNNGAFEGELMKNATEPFGPTAGLKFTAGGSKWVYVRFYAETSGGIHLMSNNKDLRLSIPAAAGKAVILKIGGNGGTLTVEEGAEEESITGTKSYEYYMLNATADTVKLHLYKNCFIQKIFVGDAPTPADPQLTATAEIEVNAGEEAQIEYSTKSDIAPTFSSSDETIAKVDATGKVTAVAAGTATITVAHAANPYFTAATAEVTVKVKTAGVTALDQLVAEAVASAEDGAATVTLAEGGEYTLDAEAVAGMVDLTIEGNGSKVVVGENGTISAKQGLTIKNVKFDAANGQQALIKLPKMTEAADTALYNLHGENGKNSFFNEKTFTLDKVSVSGLTQALLQTCDRWCLKNLVIKNSIIQLNASSGKFIDWQTNGGDGMIKAINLEGNTIYNVQANDGIFFLAYNTSKPMPEKFYGADDNTCTWTMTNNTIAQAFKQMSDRYTENKVATVKWTKNVWYSHTNLTKTRNCTFEMTATDNSGDGSVNLGNFGTKENLQITVPTDAYDFNEEALIPYFSLFKRTLAYENRMGDTRWLVEGKVAGGRVWDFSNNGENYPDEWAAIKADATNWKRTKENQDVRYQNVEAIEDAEAVVSVTVPATEEGAEPTVETHKVSFMEGLFWTADANKLIVGDGSSSNYKCLQIQKGGKFTVKGLYAGDIIAVTACSTTRNEEADNIRFTNAYPEALAVAMAGEYTEYTVTVVSDGDVTFEAAKDVRLQKLEIRPMEADYSYPGLAIRLANDMAKDVESTDDEGNVTVKEYNTKGVRMHAGDKDAIVATTKNEMVPVTYTSSDEAVVTVDAEGNFEAVAPGVATITVEQAKGAGFYGSKVERFIVVNPELAYHPIAINMVNEQAELVYTPDAIGYVAGANNNGINDYHVLPAYYGSWMFYNNGNDGDGYVQAKTGNNSWMKIDYRDGANDSVCNEVCPNSEITGFNACYRPTVSGNYDLTMDYYVTGVEKVKFYYCTSASKVGGLRLNIYEDGSDEVVYTVAGVSDTKGKAQNGFSYTVEQAGLDMTKSYKVRAVREDEGDVLVYAVKFFGDGETHGSTEITTGIHEMVVMPMGNNGAVYDLQGRRVSTMQSGQLYIKNGKKFINK